MIGQQIAEGQYTRTVYKWIIDGKFQESIELLELQLQLSPNNRAALSLLAHCLYQVEEYQRAGEIYSSLADSFPAVKKYRFSHALCLAKSGSYEEALRLSKEVPVEAGLEQDKALLQAYVEKERGNMAAAKKELAALSDEDSARLVNEGCLLVQERKLEEARGKFAQAAHQMGTVKPFLYYNVALCHYLNKQYGSSLQNLAEIIEMGVHEHPELSVGSHTADSAARSVGNSPALRESVLVEAFNLKAAIEYVSNNNSVALEALQDMPPRNEDELDPVTLHNHALIGFDTSPAETFNKLNHLLENPPYPPEAFANLLLLYCSPKMAQYDMAADIMAENEDLVQSNLASSPEVYHFLRASIARQTSPEEAFEKFDALSGGYVKQVRDLTKQIQDGRMKADQKLIKESINQYDKVLEQYIPVLMGMSSIYWEMGNWQAVEKIFKQSAEFCSDHETWRLNAAHVMFMKEDWKNAIRHYEPIVKRKQEDILDIPAIVLGNLCVSYIMTSQNDLAEDLMKQIERDEEHLLAQAEMNGFSGKEAPKTFHHCIINMVIGTLYCAKGNFEFGIVRIIKSLEPHDRRLSADTWYYAKQALVSLADNLSKQMCVLKDSVMDDVLCFLSDVEKAGKDMETDFEADDEEKRSVATEARILKHVYLQLQDA